MPPASPVRCLVVDDSAIYRKVVREVLETLPDVEVVGAAGDGEIALSQIESLKPDLVTLDLEMPRLDGIGVLKELAARDLHPAAIMVSAFTSRGAKATTTALQLGAFDFILKPATSSMEESVRQLRRDLLPKIKACKTRGRLGGPRRPAAAPSAPSTPRRQPPVRPVGKPGLPPSIVAIGISTGGPQALARLLPKLPANYPAPIVLVQHMPPLFTKSLADDLNRRCALTVKEATHGAPLRPGEVLIAPGGKHMRVVKHTGGPVAELSDDPPERNCRPAADVLFRSVAEHYGPLALGLVLTGMGDDGTLGAKALKQAGASIIAQDEASCVVYGMPKSVVDNGLADHVTPLDQIATHLLAVVGRRAAV